MEIKKNLVDPSRYGIKSPYSMTPSRIVVHNTANDASAKNEIAYMIRNDKQVSFHFAIDDKEIWQGVPLDRNTWNAGDGKNGKGNREGISIEICYSESGGERFTKAEQNAAAFIAELLHERGWGVDRVTKHQDYNGKNCPHRTLALGWQRFLDMIQAELDALTEPSGFTVQVGPFASESDAIALQSWLAYAGIEAEIVQVKAAEPEKPVEPAPTKDLEAVAKKVIRGDYGNGEARKQALRAEGYTEEEIKEIQSIVNKLI